MITGIVGYSNTGQAVEVYYRISDAPALWPATQKTPPFKLGGGSIDKWADQINSPPTKGTDYWRVFDGLLDLDGIDRLWVQIGVSPHLPTAPTDEEVLGQFKDTVEHAQDLARKYRGDPGFVLPVLVSPMHDYSQDGTFFFKRGEIEQSARVARKAIDEGLATPGPRLGRVSKRQVDWGDFPHLSLEGMCYHAGQLVEFFDFN